MDNCTHCDTGEGGQDPQKSFEGYAERAEQWSRGELPDWDVAVSGPASKAEADELKPFFDWLGSFLSSRNISSIVDVSSGLALRLAAGREMVRPGLHRLGHHSEDDRR